MNDIQLALATFVVVWVITFWPAWVVLLKLLALSASPRHVGARLWSWLIIYRLLIAAPYVVLLVVGSESLPSIIQAFIVGLLVAGLIFSIIRFRYRNKLVTGLWNIYGHVYDGLLQFTPYTRLVSAVIERAVATKPDARFILELGCGTGNVLAALKAQYPQAHLVGVDSSGVMLTRASRKVLDATLHNQDAVTFLETHKDDRQYDLIVLQNVLYAIDDRNKLWTGLERVLSPGGVIVITNSDRSGSWTIVKEHMRYGSWLAFFDIRLVLVGIIDTYISQLSKTGSFDFVSENQLRSETAGLFEMSSTTRCYGGVNILFHLRRAADG